MHKTALSILTLVILLIGGKGLFAQEQITTWFLEAPDSITPHFEKEDKDKLLEQYTFKATGLTSEGVRNVYGGNSSIESLSDTRLALRIDDRTTLEMKVLRTRHRKEPIIAMIYTDEMAPAVSVLAFYNPAKKWERSPTETLIMLPKPEDFLLKPDLKEDREVKSALIERGLWTYYASFGDDEETLLLIPTTFTEKTASVRYPLMTSKLVPGLLYKWTKTDFKPKGVLQH